MINSLIFDFDGLIIDSKIMYIKLFKKALNENRINVTVDEINETLIPSILDTIENLVLDYAMNRIELVKKIEKRIINLTAKEGLAHISINKDVTKVLKELKRKNNKLFLVSNSHSLFIKKVIKKFNLTSFFQEIISLDSGFGDKEFAIKYISKKYNMKFSELVYVGDTVKDVELAKKNRV